MPRKVPWSQGGAVGVTVTPHMVALILALYAHQDSEKALHALAFKAVSVDRYTLASTVRYVEAKVGRQLFHRNRGRGAQTWTPVHASTDFFTWCARNPAGGADYPKVA